MLYVTRRNSVPLIALDGPPKIGVYGIRFNY